MRIPLITASLLALVVSACSVFHTAADPRWQDYRGWTSVARGLHGDPTESLDDVHGGPEGYRNVFVNDVGKDMILGDGPYVYPVGTVIVKEQYGTKSSWQEDAAPDITVMLKIAPGEGSETWHWAFGNSGASANSFCSKCHDNVEEDDFVFTNAAFLGDGGD